MDVLINGIPLSSYGGEALSDYTIGETEYKPETLQGLNRTNWILLHNQFGMREIRVNIVFKGPTMHQAKINRSRLNSVLFEPVDLTIVEDGFSYRAICTDLGREIRIGAVDTEGQIKAEYTFSGIRHDPLVSLEVAAGDKVYCLSTMPYTDCRLTATVSSGTSFNLGGATFTDVAANDVLVFDGINKLVTVNGVNHALKTSFTQFPCLVPGENTITATGGNVLVEYEPAYA